MRELMLNDGQRALVDDQDYIACLQYTKWHFRRGYAIAKPMKRGTRIDIFLHHLIGRRMGYNTEPLRIDHKDGNGLNNQRDNLREATHAQNMMNRKESITNTTGYVGVTRAYNGRYQASIQVNGKYQRLGIFDTAEQAGTAYQEASRRLRGEWHRET